MERTNQSIDMLRLDNVTSGCDLIELLLGRGGGKGGGGRRDEDISEFPALNPKLVMFQV